MPASATLEEVQQTVTGAVSAIETFKGEIGAQLKKHGEFIDSMVSKGLTPEATAEHTKIMKGLEEKLTAKETELADAMKAMNDFKAEQVTRMDELQKALQRGGVPGGENGGSFKLTGAQVVEAIKANHEKFKAFGAASRGGDPRDLPAVPIGEFQKDVEGGRFVGTFAEQPVMKGYSAEDVQKALTSTPPTNLVAPYQIPGFMPLLRRQTLIRDLIPTVQAPLAQIINYIRQTGFSPSATPPTVAIVQTGGVATVTHTGHGFEEYDRIRIAGATQAGYNTDTYIHVVDANSYTYSVASGTVSPATGTPTAMRLNNFGAPAFVSETDTAPQAQMFFESRQAAIATIDFYLKVGRNIMDDLPGLQASIDSDGIFGLRLNEDRALLYGTGVAPQMSGLLTDPARQQVKWSTMSLDGSKADTKAKAIRWSRTLIELANMQANGVILHPLDWQGIETETGSTGQFIWFNNQVTTGGLNQGGENFWRVPVVVTPAIARGTWVIGDFARASVIYDRMQAQVSWANQNEADFINRLLCALFEERLGQAVKRPEGIVHGTFDSAPA